MLPARRRHPGHELRASTAPCPPAPCTSGSITTAASRAACSAIRAVVAARSPYGARTTGKRSGSNTSVPKPPSPTDSEPIESPWYAPLKAR